MQDVLSHRRVTQTVRFCRFHAVCFTRKAKYTGMTHRGVTILLTSSQCLHMQVTPKHCHSVFIQVGTTQQQAPSQQACSLPKSDQNKLWDTHHSTTRHNTSTPVPSSPLGLLRLPFPATSAAAVAAAAAAAAAVESQ